MTLSLPVAAKHHLLDTLVGQTVEASFEMSKVRLIQKGDYSIRMINGDRVRLWAVDSEDSEVIVRIKPQSGGVDGVEHANAMGK